MVILKSMTSGNNSPPGCPAKQTPPVSAATSRTNSGIIDPAAGSDPHRRYKPSMIPLANIHRMADLMSVAEPLNAPVRVKNGQKNERTPNTENNGRFFKQHAESSENTCATNDSTSTSDKQQQPTPCSPQLTWAQLLIKSLGNSNTPKKDLLAVKMPEQPKKSTDEGVMLKVEQAQKEASKNNDHPQEKKPNWKRGEGWWRNNTSADAAYAQFNVCQGSKSYEGVANKHEKKTRTRRRHSRRSKRSNPSTMTSVNSDGTNRSTTALCSESAYSLSKETSVASRGVRSTRRSSRRSTSSFSRSRKSGTVPHWVRKDPKLYTCLATQLNEQPSAPLEEQLEEQLDVRRDARFFVQSDVLLRERPDGVDRMRMGFKRAKELLVFRLENSLLSLNADYSFRGRHDSTHRTLVSFMWKSGGMRRGEYIRFFFSDAVLTVTPALYTTLKESSQTAPTEKKMLEYIRYAIDTTISGSSPGEAVQGLHVWFHSDHWREEETDTRIALEFFLRRKGTAACLFLQADGVELRQLSKKPLVYDFDLDPPPPERCVVIIGGPKGYSPWSDQDVKNVVEGVGMSFFKVSFSKTIEFTSVLAAHIQMLDDLGYLYPSMLDLLSCRSEEAYADMISSADNAIALFSHRTRRHRAGEL
eukprot:GEMP01000993.1.p1 GENE.GEMP01000993.1~~GEMP01000993.1.p1  ORF type:complete len:642 (+),score=119.74 GEMP01000993.1:405-2330(+)